MVELARFLSPHADSDAEAVKEVLKLGIKCCTDQLIGRLVATHDDILKGLLVLFGLVQPETRPTKTHGKRRDMAAPFLLGPGKDADALRRTERNEMTLEEEIVERLTDYLAQLGDIRSFTYAARFALSAPVEAFNPDRARLSQLFADTEANPIFPIRRTQPEDRELARVFKQELEHFYHTNVPSLTPILTSLARHALYPDPNQADSPDDIVTFLRWIIEQFKDQEVRQGAIEMLGVGDTTGRTLIVRLDRAAPFFSYPTGNAILGGPIEKLILDELVRKSLELSAMLEFNPFRQQR
ncbi:MAG TPA: hypothetical protein VFK14_12365 [Solirubrobacterales bacterium]|nr:hypothetical protein [Solirubrobacterales bacterium]